MPWSWASGEPITSSRSRTSAGWRQSWRWRPASAAPICSPTRRRWWTSSPPASPPACGRAGTSIAGGEMPAIRTRACSSSLLRRCSPKGPRPRPRRTSPPCGNTAISPSPSSTSSTAPAPLTGSRSRSRSVPWTGWRRPPSSGRWRDCATRCSSS